MGLEGMGMGLKVGGGRRRAQAQDMYRPSGRRTLSRDAWRATRGVRGAWCVAYARDRGRRQRVPRRR